MTTTLKNGFAATILALFAPMLACAPEVPNVVIGVQDHVDALSESPGDKLLHIIIVTTSAPMRFDNLAVYAHLPPNLTEELRISHDDVDADGAVNAGDRIDCQEGASNRFDTSHINQEFIVFLDQFNSGVAFSTDEPTTNITSGLWRPSN